MGAALCGSSGTVKGQFKKRRTVDFEDMRPQGTVYTLAVCLDYKGYPANEVGGCGPLTCTPDVSRFLSLGEQCGLDAGNIVHLKDDPSNKRMWPSRARVLDEAKQMSERCEAGDTFIFMFAGHGDSMVDDDGDEKDGSDECLCTMKPNGEQDFLRDDDFADVLREFDDDVTIIVITDCCHSGTICDLDSQDWGDKWVIHLAAVQDYQCAVDLGAGGAFTSSLLEALEEMVDGGEPHPALVDVYNRAQQKYGAMFADLDQDFSFNTTPAVDADVVAWPFYPEEYDVGTALD